MRWLVILAGTVLVLGVALSPVVRAAGGWSDDPAKNLVLADRPNDQVEVKIAPRADGGAYLSWYDNAAGGYDVTLQRLDADGVEQWAHNGVTIADTRFDWVTDHDLAVDQDGAALLAFRDDRYDPDPNAPAQATAARISPQGTPLWGDRGVQLSAVTGDTFVGPPGIISTSDDQVVAAWSEETALKVRRLSLDGKAIWPADVVIQYPPGDKFFLADLQPAPDGGHIVSWVSTASFPEPRHLFAQRFTRDGAPVWGEPDASGARQPLTVFDGGTLQYGNFPPFVPDGTGGAVFAWYETDPVLQVRVQHVRADGSTRFPQNGALTATERKELERVEPAMAYDPASQDIYAFWRQLPVASGPFRQGLYAQRFDAAGQRLWGDGGLELAPLGPNETTQINAMSFDGDVLFAWAEKLAEGDQRLWIRRLTPAGTDVWAPRVAISSAPSGKSRLLMKRSTHGFAILGWHDSRSGDQDAYVQNINPDGSLGVPGTVPTATPVTPTTPTIIPTATATIAPSPTPRPTPGPIYLPVAGKEWHL